MTVQRDARTVYNAAMSPESESERPVPAGAAQFDTTHWSVVLAAGHRSSPDSRQALESLCRTYWYPRYAYVRRRVADVHEARDLTQEFFARLLERNYVALARPGRGRFRSLLLTTFMSSEPAEQPTEFRSTCR